MAYRWSHPAAWLSERIDGIKYGKHSDADLAAMCRLLASQLDSDILQDLFQDEMDADGYFEDAEDFEQYRAEAWGSDPEDQEA